MSCRKPTRLTGGLIALSCLVVGAAAVPARSVPAPLSVPQGTWETIDKIYSFDLEQAAEGAQKMQRELPEHPLGYLLEDEALWWRFWCTSADYKWGMMDARHRPHAPSDARYLELSTKAYSLARREIARGDSAEMQLYAGMADALAARLYALRGENRSTARVGVRARQSFLRALELDPAMADADLGLGLYNYYVDTLSSMAKVLRFFMGIPGGSKQEGQRQLENAIAHGKLTPTLARVYTALNLHRYDQQYQRAIEVLVPAAEKYQSNPLFLLMLGDLHAKLAHQEEALSYYRAAAALPVADPECRARIQALAASAVAANSRESASKS